MLEMLGKLPYISAESLAWQFLLAAKDLLQSLDANERFLSLRNIDCDEPLAYDVVATHQADEYTCLWLDAQDRWCRSSHLPDGFDALFDLYLPVLGTPADAHSTRVVAHLGQSIDAQIATTSGDSFYVTGEENRKHLHCLRALSDAVIVGSSTVVADDPQLTTRAVAGENPVRVIIDSQARLPTSLGVFTDSQVSTVLLHQSSADLSGLEMSFGPKINTRSGDLVSQVNRWIVPDTVDAVSVSKIIDLLSSRGLRRLFVEGGGITVSRFFEAQALNRLHVAIAPLLVGQGTPALQLNGVAKMIQANRPPHSIYRMGEDILWDFDVSGAKVTVSTGDEAASGDVVDASAASVMRII